MLNFLRLSLPLAIIVIPIFTYEYKHTNVRLRKAVVNGSSMEDNTTIIKPGKFIIGGTNASLGEFPWQGLLLWMDINSDIFVCGATLISSRYAMTAAHCADEMIISRSVLHFGIVNLLNKNVTVFISAKFVHPNYNYTSYEVHNDIAILQLSETINTSLYVKPIALTSNDNYETYRTGVVSGWGHYYKNGKITNSTSQTLRQATVSIISQSKCKQTWKYLDSSQICAGNYLKGSAPGDSGGPLQVFHNNTWYQIGITSYGGSTEKTIINQDQYPGVYTRVSSYCDWINETTNGDAKCNKSIDYSMTTATTIYDYDYGNTATTNVVGNFFYKSLLFILLILLK